MPKVSVAIPHQMDPDDVMARARPYIEKMVGDFEGDNLELNIVGREGHFSFKSMMFQIKGTLAVDEQQIGVTIDLPFAAMMFKDKVEKAIKKNLTRALESPNADAE